MTDHGVFVPEQDAAEVGRCLLAGQRELYRNGVISPTVARYTEALLRVARSRRNVDQSPDRAASSSALGSSALSTSEAAAVLGCSIRTVQSLAASGVIGERVGGRWVITREEAEREKSRRAGKADLAGSAARTNGDGPGDDGGIEAGAQGNGGPDAAVLRPASGARPGGGGREAHGH